MTNLFIVAFGALGRTRTDTPFRTPDFESSKSTNFITRAYVEGWRAEAISCHVKGSVALRNNGIHPYLAAGAGFAPTSADSNARCTNMWYDPAKRLFITLLRPHGLRALREP